MENNQVVGNEHDSSGTENSHDVDKPTSEIENMPDTPENILTPGDEETADMPDLQAHTTVFPNSPVINEANGSTSSVELDNPHALVDDHVPSVLLSEPNSISTSVSLLHHQPVILTASALPGLLAPVLGSPEIMEDGISENERHTGLLITTKNTSEDLLNPKTEALGGSCIVVGVIASVLIFICLA